MNVRQLGEVQSIGKVQNQLRHALHTLRARIKAKPHPGGVERRTHTATYYHTCPYCGANLDPGETCDCQTTAQTENPPTEKVSTVDTSERNENNEYTRRLFQYQKNL